MAPIRHNPLRSTCDMVHHMVRLRLSRHGAGVRKEFWLDEHHWSHDPAVVSLLSTMVREYVRPGARHLLSQGLACRSGTHRPAIRYSTLHARIHRISNGFRRVPFAACRKRGHGSPFHESCLPTIAAPFRCLRPLVVVGDHVPFPPLRR